MPIWAAALLAALVPIFVFLVMQIRVRSFWDVNNAVLGLLYGLISAAVFQVFLKWLIGGLRPHFLAVCQPDVTRIRDQYDAKGFQELYFTRDICTGDANTIDDSLESFPSGHTTAAFAGFVYLYLYLNAKLKVFANYHPAMWKLVVIYAPILGAMLIGGALTIDEFHNWYDIVFGALIGTVMAFSAYRMTYAAIWDWRINHIPLSRGVPFNFANPELAHTTFTHRAGWGRGTTSGGSATSGAYGDKTAAVGIGNGHHQHQPHLHGGVAHGPDGINVTSGVSSRKPVGSSGVGSSGRTDDMV